MGIDGNPFPLGLLQDQFHILQVVAGNQDGLAFFMAQGDLGRYGMAISFGVGGVQDFHGPQIDLAAFMVRPIQSFRVRSLFKVAASPSCMKA